MSIKDKLKAKAGQALAVKAPQPAQKKNEILIIITRLKNNIEIYNENKLEIVKDLMYLKNNQEELKNETGQSFEEFLKDVTQFSKSYFYQLTGVYEFLLPYNKTELINEKDIWILEQIKKRKAPELLKKIDTLNRKYFKEHESDRRTPPLNHGFRSAIEYRTIKGTRTIEIICVDDDLFFKIDKIIKSTLKEKGFL